VGALVDRIEADLGPVTTLVSNAGVPARVRGDMLDLSPENFDFVLDVNLRGTFFLAQEVARRMIGRGSTYYRSLVFVTSVSAAAASPERAEYCISKAGAAMVAQLFAVRLAPHGIGVFDVRPGIVETAMTAAVKDKYTARIEGGLVPAGRWGHPHDVASAVMPLVIGLFGFATGAVVPVDGGLSIPRL
jgi:NAD(P)-dependent dehydrogenase (short-subunit alcohol dehydrogenase family)